MHRVMCAVVETISANLQLIERLYGFPIHELRRMHVRSWQFVCNYNA